MSRHAEISALSQRLTPSEVAELCFGVERRGRAKSTFVYSSFPYPAQTVFI